MGIDIGSRTDCLCLQGFHRIRYRHFTWHHTIEIFLYGKFIDYHKALSGLPDFHTPPVGWRAMAAVYGKQTYLSTVLCRAKHNTRTFRKPCTVSIQQKLFSPRMLFRKFPVQAIMQLPFRITGKLYLFVINPLIVTVLYQHTDSFFSGIDYRRLLRQSISTADGIFRLLVFRPFCRVHSVFRILLFCRAAAIHAAYPQKQQNTYNNQNGFLMYTLRFPHLTTLPLPLRVFQHFRSLTRNPFFIFTCFLTLSLSDA